MTEPQRMLWGNIRERGWLRYVVLHGILQFGLPICALLLLFNYFFHSLTGGQWYGWRWELLFNIPWWIICGIIIGAVQWRSAERRYPLEPVPAADRATALEREVARTRGFALFCLAAVFVLAAILLRGCGKT